MFKGVYISRTCFPDVYWRITEQYSSRHKTQEVLQNIQISVYCTVSCHYRFVTVDKFTFSLHVRICLIRHKALACFSDKLTDILYSINSYLEPMVIFLTVGN